MLFQVVDVARIEVVREDTRVGVVEDTTKFSVWSETAVMRQNLDYFYGD